jgi:hypothetical protein
MSAPVPVRRSLQEVSLPALLRPLVRQKKTGVLRMTRGAITKTVYLSEGRLIFATSTDPDDRLGERLLVKGLISYRNYEDSVRALKAGKRQGTILVENGAIRSKDLIMGVGEQVQEIIYSLFSWEDGEGEFQEGPLPSREVIVLRMSTGDLILEGIRRIQGWTRIRSGVGSLDQKYQLSGEATTLIGGLTLPKLEMNLVATLDGPATLEEICASTRQSDFLVCRAVWGLWAAGILDRVPEDLEAVREKPHEDTKPHERTRGASVGREIELFNELHRLLFDLVTYELRERAPGFLEGAVARARGELPALFDGVTMDRNGDLDPVILRRNIVSREVASYLRGLGRLLEIELGLVRENLGPRKATIIENGLRALRNQQKESHGL